MKIMPKYYFYNKWNIKATTAAAFDVFENDKQWFDQFQEHGLIKAKI